MKEKFNIFNKKKVIEEKIIEENNPYDNNDINSIPSNSGNAQQTRYELDAQNTFNASTIPQNREATNKKFEELYPSYSLYFLMMFYSNYFVGRFNIIVENKLQQKAIADAMLCGYYYGRGAIMKTQDGKTGQIKLIPYGVNRIALYPNGDIKRLRLTPSSLLISSGKEIDAKNQTIYSKSLEIEPKNFKHVAIYQWNNQGQSCWVRLLPFITNMKTWLQKISINGVNFSNKLLYTMSDPTSSLQELEDYIDPTRAVILRTGLLGDNDAVSLNKFNHLGEKQPDITNFLQAFHLFKSENYELLGIEFDKDPKAERKTVGEVEASAGFGKSSEYDYFLQVEAFKYQLEQLLDHTVELANYSIVKKETE